MYFVYLTTNKNHTVIYVGYTDNLFRRINEHRNKIIKGFTSKYNVDKLVYFEEFNRKIDAMKREQQLIAGSRQKKIELIHSTNPEWSELLPPDIERLL